LQRPPTAARLRALDPPARDLPPGGAGADPSPDPSHRRPVPDSAPPIRARHTAPSPPAATDTRHAPTTSSPRRPSPLLTPPPPSASTSSLSAFPSPPLLTLLLGTSPPPRRHLDPLHPLPDVPL